MSELEIIPRIKNVEAQYVEMMVPLYSYGCERKIKKALAHFKGIYSVKVGYGEQKVGVWGICNKEDVLSAVQNKRRGARFWCSDDNIHPLHSQTSSAPSSPSTSYRKRTPLGLMIKARSLGWKTWNKVFLRSYSF